jgi:tRNA-dihydrouridine synthase A
MTTAITESTASAPAAAGRRGAVPPLSVAPMMDRTDRHFRAFLRRITRSTLLYTEMVTTGAVIHGDRDHLLGFSPEERPLALQLGGEDAAELAECARIAFDRGYDEVNLNVGCPSERVQRGRFGACLMAEPRVVAEAVAAMRAAVPLPVTVKHRIGIDDLDRFEDMARFVETVAAAGCDRFSVHARKAWLRGLSPKQNREVPPLRWEDVHRLKRLFPHLAIEVNGGIRDLAEARRQLAHVDGVMIGRAAYDDPYLFAPADRDFFDPAAPVPSRREVVEAWLPYAEAQAAAGVPLHRVVHCTLGLFAGRPGARAWRRHLSEHAHRPGAGPDLFLAALDLVPAAVAGERT